MSWEGYNQVLCKNGHNYDTSADIDLKKWTCPFCKKKCAWWNIVDTTNGSYDNGERIDGYVELKEETEAVNCKCFQCGNMHISKPATYKIPKNLGHKL